MLTGSIPSNKENKLKSTEIHWKLIELRPFSPVVGDVLLPKSTPSSNLHLQFYGINRTTPHTSGRRVELRNRSYLKEIGGVLTELWLLPFSLFVSGVLLGGYSMNSDN